MMNSLITWARLRILAIMIIGSVFIFYLPSCDNRDQWERNNQVGSDPELFLEGIGCLTEVIRHDSISSPAASRIFAYATIAAYEAAIIGNDDFVSLAGQLSELDSLSVPDVGEDYWPPLASVQAFTRVGRHFVFSENLLKIYQDSVYKTMKTLDIPGGVFRKSIEVGNKIADQVLSWAGNDNYKKTRAFPGYIVQNDLQSWKPTPPNFRSGLEPHWGKLRKFVLDSTNQFNLATPSTFNIHMGSPFYSEVREVYDVVTKLNKLQLELVDSWFPQAPSSKGEQKILINEPETPEEHWLNISSIACKNANVNYAKTAEVVMLVSVGIADAYISCWDKKWKELRIRPETVISQFIDDNWKPLVPSPSYPEYPSELCVISGTAAKILEQKFGQSFAFTDSTIISNGMVERSYDSFHQAATQAAISNLYVGINYLPSVNSGLSMGTQIGEFINNKLITRKKSSQL